MLTGEKILVTGASGMVGAPLAIHLAEENEVWGVARFGDAAKRDALEQAGVKTLALDLGAGDYSSLPDDFTYVLHLNWLRAGLDQLDQAVQTNVIAPGLVMQHCRNAKAHLVMSGMPVYTPNPDPMHLFTETDSIGASSYSYAPTSPYSKAGVEAVARFCAQAFDIKVVIARLNSVVGPANCFPAQIIRGVLSGSPLAAPHDCNMQSPIHIEDMKWQIEPLLNAATNPAFIVNWGGDEHMTVQDWVARVNEWSGKNATVTAHSLPGAPIANAADPTLRRSVTGPCRTDFDTELRKLYDHIVATEDFSASAPDLAGISVRKTQEKDG